MAISPGKQEFDGGQEMSSFLMAVAVTLRWFLLLFICSGKLWLFLSAVCVVSLIGGIARERKLGMMGYGGHLHKVAGFW